MTSNPGALPEAFTNVYDDDARAKAYATLDFPGTYYLAYRDLPAIIAEHVQGRKALDFGCGAGRSTRFLQWQGFQATGVDISRSMIELAASLDPGGTYRLVEDGDLRSLEPDHYDLVLSAFAFDNIPGTARRQALLRDLRHLLGADGRIILLGSTPDIYTHEWASFTTKAFPENRNAKSGETVQIVMKDVADGRPVVDVVWSDADYRDLFAASGLELLAHYTPLARDEEGRGWLAETQIAPWVIYVLKKAI